VSGGTDGAALAGLTGWDVPQLRGAVGTLARVGERLGPWRYRLDALGRQLAAAECWSGPAGTAAAAALLEVSTVSSGLQDALDESGRHLQRLVVAADEAQDLAVAALRTAEAGGVPLDPQGTPVVATWPVHAAMTAAQRADAEAGQLAAVRAGVLAAEAFAASARALAAAVEAGSPLAALRGALGPAGSPDGRLGGLRFVDLVALLAPTGPVLPPAVPHRAGEDPARVAGWWAALTARQQVAALHASPELVGALDGLPAWARDRANRLLLDRALQELPAGDDRHATATAVAAEIARQEAAGQAVQLLQFRPADDQVSLALGDLDAAAAVAVLVPGIFTTPVDDLGGLVDGAADVAAAARAASPGLAVAAVAWLGYRTPATVLAAPSSQVAQRGGPALDRALDGWAAARAAPGSPPARTTVVAHSYGTLVAGRAAQAPGRLAADALVLLGSPGTEADTAGDLEAGEVHGAWSLADPVSWSGWFGRGPVSPFFGDLPLPTEATQGHTQYLHRDRPTLAAIGEVVAGTRGRP
jgi:hypothetical protein